MFNLYKTYIKLINLYNDKTGVYLIYKLLKDGRPKKKKDWPTTLSESDQVFGSHVIASDLHLFLFLLFFTLIACFLVQLLVCLLFYTFTTYVEIYK